MSRASLTALFVLEMVNMISHNNGYNYGVYDDDDREWADLNGEPYEPPHRRYYEDPVYEVVVGHLDDPAILKRKKKNNRRPAV